MTKEYLDNLIMEAIEYEKKYDINNCIKKINEALSYFGNDNVLGRYHILYRIISNFSVEFNRPEKERIKLIQSFYEQLLRYNEVVFRDFNKLELNYQDLDIFDVVQDICITTYNVLISPIEAFNNWDYQSLLGGAALYLIKMSKYKKCYFGSIVKIASVFQEMLEKFDFDNKNKRDFLKKIRKFNIKYRKYA